MKGPKDGTAAPVHPAEIGVEWVTGLALAGAGMASGFTHLITNASRHGVSTPLAWATAVTVELFVLYAGLKVHRRLSDGRPVWPPGAALVVGFGLSMASQLATADPSGWGWIYAAWPVVAFLWVAKLTVSDLAHRAADRAIREGQDAEVQRLTAQVHDLGQRLAHEGQVNRSLDQRLTLALDQVQRLMTPSPDPVLGPLPDPPREPLRGPADRVPRRARKPVPEWESQMDRAKRIASEYEADGVRRRPTPSELVKAAGVSVSTAKRALSELRDEPSLRLVEGSA